MERREGPFSPGPSLDPHSLWCLQGFPNRPQSGGAREPLPSVQWGASGQQFPVLINHRMILIAWPSIPATCPPGLQLIPPPTYLSLFPRGWFQVLL